MEITPINSLDDLRNLKIGSKVIIDQGKTKCEAVYLGKVKAYNFVLREGSKIKFIRIFDEEMESVQEGVINLKGMDYDIHSYAKEDPRYDSLKRKLTKAGIWETTTLDTFVQNSGMFGEPSLESQLREAVQAENYERAAQLRDEIHKGK